MARGERLYRAPAVPRTPARRWRFLATLGMAWLALAAWPDTLETMESELRRSLEVLAEQPDPVYFLSYEITEDKVVSVYGSFGAVGGWNESEQRGLDIDLRVGSPELDNTHELRRGGALPHQRVRMQAPVSDEEALRTTLWRWTDHEYKQASERFTQVKTDVQVTVAAEDSTGDFSEHGPERATERPVSLEVDRAAWEAKVRKYTAPFRASKHILSANALVWADAETRWYVNSEGSAIRTANTFYRISISASTRADDGMVLPRTEQFFALSPDNLPPDEEVMAAAHRMVAELDALRTAPLVEPYTGPAILSGRASGVFFHEILGHRLEGHRQKSVREGQTFRRMVGQSVLPETFSVYFDPTVARSAGTDLVGSYRFDNEGVKARRVPVIENGILTGFLMGRMPIEGFPKSNGHGRKNTGFRTVARQSNMFVDVSEGHSRSELKAMLLEAVEREGKPWGLFFDRIQGGFTVTGRMLPNSFNVTPTVVYRIHPDGSEEMVRGADLIGTPLTTFSRIVAAGNEPAVFNGTCGAESGLVPVATVSPAILVAQIEVQKKATSQGRLPILPPPGAAAIGASR